MLLKTLIKVLLSGSVAVSAAVLPENTGVAHRATNYVGYLVSTFTDASPTVQFHLSKGNYPGSFYLLNKAQPIFASTVGTKGVRDLYLAHNSARTKFYLLATGMIIHMRKKEVSGTISDDE